MNEQQYHVENAVEAEHWWYKNRRVLLADTLRHLGIAKNAAILDAGCGTGPNLRVLRDQGYDQITAFDFSPAAVAHCHSKGFGFVTEGDIHNMSLPDATFDLVLSTDTLAYLDDAKALAEMYRVLKHGGTLLLTAPALQCLWGQNDQDIGHKRRYSKDDVSRLVRTTGFELRELYYFNYILFPPIWLVRKINNMLGPRKTTESEMTSPLVNSVLSRLFWLDIKTARRVNPPAGVSVLAVGVKKI